MSLQSHIKFILARSVIRTLGLLSLNSARRLGQLLGLIGFYLNTRARKITQINLRLCFPNLTSQQINHLTKESLIHTGQLAAEICVLWHPHSPHYQNFIQNIYDDSLAHQILAKGKGLIVLAPHLGNWEILGYHVAQFGHSINLYQPPKLAKLDTLIRQGRAKSGSQLAPTNAKGVAMLLKTLHQNGVTGILPDQNPNDMNSGIFVPFYNQSAFTMTLAHKIAIRSGAGVLLAFAKRTQQGFDLYFKSLPDDFYNPDPKIALSAMNLSIQELIALAPSQYQWEYKRFKITPPEHPQNIYAE